jgi:soluble cytochrome b562
MKIRLLLLSLILGLAVAPALKAQDAPKPAAKDGDTELGGKMDDMNDAFKKLRRNVPDATKNDDSLKLVAAMQSAAGDALKLTPAKAADLPEADRPKFVADYQAKMKMFIEMLGKLETALKAGDNASAQKIVADLFQTEKDAHTDFRKKKPKM